MQNKSGEKEFLKSYIVLSSCHLTCTGHLACQGEFNGTSQHCPQKGQCRNSKIFPPLLLAVKVDQYIFFPETCFASTISEPEFTVCPKTYGTTFISDIL